MKTKNLFLSTAIAITALFISCNEPEPEPFLRVNATTFSTPPEASGQSIVITSNVAWKVSVGDDADWFTIDQMQGENNATLRVEVKANPIAEERNAVITITAGSLNRSVTLTQTGASPRLSTYPNFINADGMGELPGGRVAYTLNVTSTLRWTAQVMDAELQDWISIAPTSGAGDGVITITLDSNMKPARRHAFISVSADGIHRRDTVFQRAAQSMPANQFNSVTINGITWAKHNVNEVGYLTRFPQETGKYFQFNRPTAYSVVDGRAEPSLKYEVINENLDWSILNNPCPCGWRVPTATELNNLRNSGFRWMNEPRGAWFGTDAQTATFDTPGNAIFLPAGGVILQNEHFAIFSQLANTEGLYWAGIQGYIGHDSRFGPILPFSRNGAGADPRGSGLVKGAALLIRCVME